jgi:hypothetical protein
MEVKKFNQTRFRYKLNSGEIVICIKYATVLNYVNLLNRISQDLE